MTSLDLQGVHFFTDPDGRTVRYLPGAASPERDPAGRPTLLLVATGAGAMLQLGTRWSLDEARKAELLPELKRSLGDSYRALSVDDLQPAPATVDSVTLLLGDGAGHFTALGTSKSSGYQPYSAIFSAMLDANQRGLAAAALGGRKELLKIDYAITLPSDVAQTFAAAPPALVSTDVATWFEGADWKSHFLVAGTS